MYREISNSDDVIDSRDVIKRIEELESLRDDLDTEKEDLQDELNNLKDKSELTLAEADSIESINHRLAEIDDWDESDDGQELKALLAFQDEFEGYCPDWRHGVTLIRESYWVEYCKDLCKDIGDFPKDLPDYIASNINWYGVAKDLQADYTSGDYDGITYWAR